MDTKDLQNAIWDILNYLPYFVLLIDEKYTIKLSNYALATTLGFEDEQEVVGKNWLNFVEPNYRDKVEENLNYLMKNPSICMELSYKITPKQGDSILTKWNVSCSNGGRNFTIKIGAIAKDIKSEIVEDSIESYFRNVLKKDRTLIQSLKMKVLANNF